MRLVYIHAPDRAVRTGDEVTFRGERAVVQEVERPRHATSPGRVYVTRAADEHGRVYGAEPRELGLMWAAKEEA